MVRLPDVCGLNMGQSPKSSSYNFNGDGLPFFQGNADFGELKPTARIYCNKPTKIANKNDLLLSVRAPIGALNIAGEKCCIGRGLAAITAKKGLSDTKFLFHVLKQMNEELNQKGTGSTFKAINKQNLSELLLPLPPLEIQKQIAKTLDTTSELLTMRKLQLSDLDMLIKSVFYDTLGDPVQNEKGWNKKRLIDECDIITGNTPSRKDPNNYGSFIEWIKSDNINTDNIYLSEATEYLSEKGFSLCRFVEAPSVLMTCIAGSIKCIGNVGVADRKVAFNQQINAIVPKKNNVLYLYTLFLLTQSYIQSTINMSLKGILSKGRLSELEFTFPPIPMQNRFAKIIVKIEEQKALVQKAIDETQLLFDSLMSQYFE